MPSVLTNPPRLPLVAPSILSADFADMGRACASLFDAPDEAGRADMLHLDVMDGHFVPNLTMGPDMCAALRRAFPETPLDAHLMVTDPAQYVAPFADAGADHVTFHIEPALGVMRSRGPVEAPPHYDARAVADEIHKRGMTAGLAINPPTSVDALLPLLGAFELVLVMSVHPGYSGQSFIEETLETTRRIRGALRADQRLQMDGGLTPELAPRVREAGCDVLVAASAIFKQPPTARGGVISALRGPLSR